MQSSGVQRLIRAAFIAALLVSVSAHVQVASADASTVDAASPEAAHEVEPLGVFDGDVSNWLPSNYTVKIARFGSGSSSCATWGYYGAGPTYTCTHWWLPSGQADDQIRGSNFDTDGFMVESTYRVEVQPAQGGYSFTVPAYKWTKISNGWNVNCSLSGTTPVCTIN